VLLVSYKLHKSESLLNRVPQSIIGDVITSMLFLSQRHVMLGVVPSSIAAVESTLIVVDFVAESPGTRRLGELQNAFIFHFPPLVENARIHAIRSHPSPAWKPASVPFFTARHHRLCVITLIKARINGWVIENLFALGDVFLSLIQNASRTPAHFDWQSWGPDGTRIITLPFLGIVLNDVHGTRYVSATPQPHAKCVCIYDFNQLALKWAKKNCEIDVANTEIDFLSESTEGEDQESYINVTMPTTLRGSEIFQDEIETRLGYRVKRLNIPKEPDMIVLCSEDCIVIQVSISEQKKTWYLCCDIDIQCGGMYALTV
jgi:hypothetical protein